jgi:hypothetical protein
MQTNGADIVLACVMNVLTYCGAYTLYSHATLDIKQSLALRMPIPVDVFTKYRNRGFTFVTSFTGNHIIPNMDVYSPNILRFVGDHHTRHIVLPTLTSAWGCQDQFRAEDDPVQLNTWTLTTLAHRLNDHPDVGVRVARVQYTGVMRSPLLRFVYVVTGPELARAAHTRMLRTINKLRKRHIITK